MFEYIINNIKRQKVKALLLVIGITILITMVITITRIVSYQLENTNLHAAAISGRIVIQPGYVGTEFPPVSIDLQEDLYKELIDLNFFQEYLSSPVLCFTIEPPDYPTGPPKKILIGIKPGAIKAISGEAANETQILLGELILEKMNDIIIGYGLYRTIANEDPNFGINSEIILFDQKFIVRGILDTSIDPMVDNAYLIPLQTSQEIFKREGFVSSFVLTLKALDTLPAAIEQIEGLDRSYAVITNEVMATNMKNAIQLFENMVVTISLVVIVVAILLIMTVMLNNIRERTKEIGILRALGMKRSTIIYLLSGEILLISLTGSILGGTIASLVLKYFMLEDLFDVMHILLILPIAIIISVASSIIPSLKILKIDPIKALHNE